MIRERGYTGSEVQLRRTVARLRPPVREPFLRLHTFPAEQAQADWANFGVVAVGRARRRLSCFVITLSYSRALYLEFFFDQTMENFLRGHVHGFQDWGGQPRVILYDNLKSADQKRRGEQTLSLDKVSHASLPMVRSVAAARFTSTPDCWSCAP